MEQNPSAKKTSKDLRVRLGEDLKGDFDQMLTDRQISQQDAVIAIAGWIVKQEPIVQAQVLGQIPEPYNGAVADEYMRRLAGDPAKLRLVRAHTAGVDAARKSKLAGKTKPKI